MGPTAMSPPVESTDRVVDGEVPMGSCRLVLFGASGDLTQRIVMPALFRLARRGALSPDFSVIGYGSTPMTDNELIPCPDASRCDA